MIALTGMLAVVLLALLAAPDTEIGRLCHRQLVERPVRWLAELERKDVILWFVLLAFALSGGEAFMLMGPELMGAFALDLALYIDVMLVAYAASFVGRLRGMRTAIMALVRRPFRRARVRAKRRRVIAQRLRKPANDDEPRPVEIAA